MQRYIKFKLPFFGPTLSGALNLNPRKLNHTKKETLTAELVDCFGKGSNKCRFGTLKSSPIQNQCPQKPTLMLPLTHKGGWMQERERCGIICSRTQGRIPNSNTVSEETELNNQNHRRAGRLWGGAAAKQQGLPQRVLHLCSFFLRSEVRGNW